ncbi:sodium:solute symporter family transporter [Albibacterium profundi]|uniref:Na+:solute symporter n=1 Tax=Albibacterium profundi TaxID=3134906 RepID=A0ABV5C9Z6_9SPHI
MELADYIIILIYFAGLLVLGGVLGKKVKTSEDMFIAGRNSSWWLSGLSTYMTIFSASTFVVWGGVAYRSGIVAVVIAMMLGIATFFVGWFVVGKWSKQQIDSPAEYLGIRFNTSVVRFYTIIGIVGRGIHMAVALYAIAIMAVALIPLPEGHWLANPTTGHLSVTYAVLFLGIITLIYTAAGGFLAVLMTDVVQFAVLFGMILIMVPLSFDSVGGVGAFIEKAPDGFFSLFSEQYSWGWMVLWLCLNFFMIGGDWAFVQRYISVPSVKEAKKSAYLVGTLYIVTPILWYTPALVYQVVNPDANPEQAYMLMSQYILKAGMVGLMLAAMISATLSTVSSNLNVFANVFAYDIFRPARPNVSDRTLISSGRWFTYIYGLLITGVAVMIPYFGGAERVVVPILTLVISPLFIPSIWGLFSKRIGSKAVWWSMGITFFLGITMKTGLFFEDFVSRHVEFVDAFIGFVVPCMILLVIELFLWKQETDAGWNRYTQASKEAEYVDPEQVKKNKVAGDLYSSMGIKIMMGTYAAIGIAMGVLAFFDPSHRGELLLYAALFIAVSALVLFLYFFKWSKNKAQLN